MNVTYTEIKDELTGKTVSISRSDGWSIPIDPANSDYQRYLRWLENPDAEEGTLGTNNAETL